MNATKRILVVDDDRSVAALVVAVLRRAGFLTSQASGYTDGLRALEADPCDAIVSDVFLGEGKTGLDLMHARSHHVPVILMTGMADLDTSVAAIKAGAVECLPKPLEFDRLIATVTKAVTATAEMRPVEGGSTRRRIVGRSKAIVDLFSAIGRAALSDAPVLITGEEGVGKDFVAHEIHRHGPRGSAPIESILCSGLSPGEFDIELQRAVAPRGSVLLKHVDELPPRAQQLLATRLGRESGARFIGTARKAVSDDLLYALGVVHLHVPALRDRTEDAPLIVDELLREIRSTKPLCVSDAALRFIRGYGWTGNVRQLAYALRAAAARTSSGVLDEDDLRAVLAIDESATIVDVETSAPADLEETEAAPSVHSIAAAPEGTPRFHNNRYMLYKRLARTGLSEVWLGWQPSLWRKVVVKYLAGTADEEIERFKREARIHASLKHEGIPAVHEVGVDPETQRRYLVLEFIDGMPLADYNRRLGAAVSDEERIATMVRLTASVAGVLGYLHANGFAHRDVKPQNILVTPAEQSYLIDYGMARSIADGETLTTGNVVQGTIPFMSPEHVAGRGATAAADIWCLGASLYNLLTGQYPFGSGEFTGVAQRIRATDLVPARRLNPRIPIAVERVLERALQKDPAKRYFKIQDMANELSASGYER